MNASKSVTFLKDDSRELMNHTFKISSICICFLTNCRLF
uniref:Uncharacterized protein n=1 Tax=Anguilla anguilla TaxID=7936 RepID=A0A0E9PNS9_ANGAN